MKTLLGYKTLFALTIVLTAASIPSSAAVITTEARQKMEETGQFDDYVRLLIESKADGLNIAATAKSSSLQSASSSSIDTLTVLVLLVDFSDKPYTGDKVAAEAADFQDILFSTGGLNPTGSMTEYYLENSYGTFYVRGDVRGWYRMPQLYSYYVNEQGGIGSVFPHNSRGLAYDAVNIANQRGVDFSIYDTYGNNGPDGEIDGLLIIHAGPGMERTGDLSDMQSHKWDLGIYYQYLDGILIDNYTIQPEEYVVSTVSSIISPIGIFCHEFGHVIGLPDLYDVDYDPSSSSGIGNWSLMATGCYLNDTKKPAHMDAWCKAHMGYLDPIEVYENMTDVEFPRVETEPVVYRLWKDGSYGLEYFLIENRGLAGFDSYLPGEGLIIYHIDDRATYNNNDVYRYHVAVEQADGLFQLEFTHGNKGDAGDPWPGMTDKRSFDDLSEPNSKGYGNVLTRTSVWNISDPGPLMTANLDIEWSRCNMDLENCMFVDENGNGYLEAGERIEAYFGIMNYWIDASDVTIEMSAKNPGIVFGVPTVEFGVMPGDGCLVDNLGNPFVFYIPDSLTPIYDSFYIAVEADGGAYNAVFGIEQMVGRPQILIVDDDRGAAYDTIYVNDLYRKMIPAEVWHKDSLGTPPSTKLNKFNMVFWFTGDTCATGTNYLSSTDISSIKQYLENGGNFFLSGQGLSRQLQVQNPDFLTSFLHSEYVGPLFSPYLDGISGSPIGDQLALRFVSESNMQYMWGDKIMPTGGAIPAFSYKYYADGYAGLSFSGNYRVVFFDFCFEAVDNFSARYNTRDTVLFNILNFFGNITTEVAEETEYNLMPFGFSLEQNFPNPFNPTTRIQYTIENIPGQSRAHIRLEIFNILGQEIGTLIDENQSPGTYMVEWDGFDARGCRVGSGVYFYRLESGNQSISKKMILLK
ncbi:MAG: M6 family metalloprotease domain-containing protein [Candidatus Zixiibacteriota bacterium]